MASLLSAAVLVTAVKALAFDGQPARPTYGAVPNPTFQFPEITLPPSIRELAKRQGGDTVLVGPDNTCGYFDGRPGAVYTCNGKDVTCALVTTSSYGAVACCDGSGCGLRVACIDYEDFMLSSACDNGCIQDTYTVKCTRASAPYCGTVSFFDGIEDYYCDTVSDSTPQQLYTTYDGETDGRSFTAVVITLSDDTTSSHSSQTTSVADDDDDNDTHPSTTSPASPSSGDINSQESGSSNNDSKKSSSTNVGAIAGGVVGGVAGLALIGLAIFFIVRHNQKKKNSNAAAAGAAIAPQMQGPSGPGSPPAGNQGFPQQPQSSYNPHLSQQYPQQPGQQPGYYEDPTKLGGFTAVVPAQLPDRNDSTSPVSDGRLSQQPPTSPTSTVYSGWNQQPQQQPGVYGVQQQHNPNATPPPNMASVPPTVHEAGGNVVGQVDYNSNHHGQLHEMG